MKVRNHTHTGCWLQNRLWGSTHRSGSKGKDPTVTQDRGRRPRSGIWAWQGPGTGTDSQPAPSSLLVFPFHSAATVLTPRKPLGGQVSQSLVALAMALTPYLHTSQYLSPSLPNLSQAGCESISFQGPSDYAVSTSLGTEGGVLVVFSNY